MNYTHTWMTWATATSPPSGRRRTARPTSTAWPPKDLGVTGRGPGVRACDKAPSPRPLTLSGEMPVVE